MNKGYIKNDEANPISPPKTNPYHFAIKEKGIYHNCHRNNYLRDGLGILDYKDTDKRKIVDEDVISYLLKDDDKQDITVLKNNKNDRAFSRGTLPKSKGNKGRPRG